MQFSNPPKEDSVEHVVISGESNAHREKLGEQEQIVFWIIIWTKTVAIFSLFAAFSDYAGIPLLFQTIQVFKKDTYICSLLIFICIFIVQERVWNASRGEKKTGTAYLYRLRD